MKVEHVSSVDLPCCWAPYSDGQIVTVEFHSGKFCTITMPDGSEQDVKCFAPKKMFEGSRFICELFHNGSNGYVVEFFSMTRLCGAPIDSCLAERLPRMIETLHSVRCVHETPSIQFVVKTFKFTAPDTEAIIFDLKGTGEQCRVYSPLPRVCLQLSVNEHGACSVPADIAKIEDLCSLRVATAEGVDVSESLLGKNVRIECATLPREGPCIFSMSRDGDSVTLRLKGPTSDAPLTLAELNSLLDK